MSVRLQEGLSHNRERMFLKGTEKTERTESFPFRPFGLFRLFCPFWYARKSDADPFAPYSLNPIAFMAMIPSAHRINLRLLFKLS